ncbi:MAG: glycosyltransferase family 4 protein [Bacteroidetes bacterium]|nr:glycosyltransferase family 4 protein [Fibrella sp.]
MTVTYLFRAPGTGHSIEELFGSIRHETDRRESVTTHEIRLPYVSRSLGDLWRNYRFVRRQSLGDIVHITGDAHYVALVLPGSRTALTIHDCVTLERNRNRPIRYALFWLLWFYWPVCRAGVVTAPSEKTRRELICYLGRVAEKIVVVPNGYDPAFTFQPKPFRTDRPVLLQPGTAPHKNLSRLIEAIDGIVCTLVIIGPLPDEVVADLRKHQITYRNYVDLSRAEIVQHYVDCDIVTFVSTYEGFGMPILEANAVGRAVITSDIAPLRDVAGEAAHLVDPGDVTAIRRGILQLIQDDAYRQALIDAGRQNARRYTVANAAAHYATLYRQFVPDPLLTEPAR